MSSDVSRTASRSFPTELGALGGAIALWAALCAVAATEAGALLGSFIGFGVALLSLPFVLMGQGAAMPVIIGACLGLGVLLGAVQVVMGLRRPDMQSQAIRGVHFIGCSAALFLCLRDVLHTL
jgi:hypothetical protein